jgi:hypothetical protein
MGVLSPSFTANNYKTIILSAGNTRDTLTIEDALALGAFLASGTAESPRNLVLCGEYMFDGISPDGMIASFLSEYMGAIHVSDSGSNLWGVYVAGLSGDAVSDGMILNVSFGGASSGAQRSIGVCRATAGSTEIFRYRDSGTNSCAVKRETETTKTFYAEWSLSGVSVQILWEIQGLSFSKGFSTGSDGCLKQSLSLYRIITTGFPIKS